MGRPIKGLYFGTGTNRLTVSDYSINAGIIININTGVTINRQKSSNQFLLSGPGFTNRRMTLVNKLPGQLDANEFRINGWDANGAEYNVVRIYNRTLRLSDGAGNFYKVPWSNIAESGPRTFSISFPSGSPVVVTDNNHGLVTGDVITIDNTIPSSISNTYTITVTGTNTFILDGTDGDDHNDSLVQTGAYRGAGLIATLETQ